MTGAAVDFDRILREERPQAQRLAQYIRSVWNPTQVLDVGAGPGLYVEELRKAGVRSDGVDNDFRSPRDLVMYSDDITKGLLPPPADFVLCLEVLEHVPEERKNSALHYLGWTGARRILFSAAQPGQGGEGHVNCQFRAYWVEQFCGYKFWLDPDETDDFRAWLRIGPHMGWLYNNALVFRRRC